MAGIAVMFVMVSPPWADQGAAKPFSKIDNREIFMRTIELYANRERILQRILCVLPDDLTRIQQKYAAHLGFQGVSLATGGPDWFAAVARGLEKLKPEIDLVIIHDACCPAVPYGVLDALEQAAAKYGAAVPLTSTGMALVKINDQQQISEGVDSTLVRVIQSPQAFQKDVLLAAYARRSHLGDGLADDAALVGACGGKITAVPGWRLNLRVDGEEMVRMAGDLLRHLPKPRSKAPLSPFEEAQW
jgi:2-C-methyl-D-erythritol 4-phosphate cytidylyltransferase